MGGKGHILLFPCSILREVHIDLLKGQAIKGFDAMVEKILGT